MENKLQRYCQTPSNPPLASETRTRHTNAMTKTETNVYPLNADQLELLFNLPYYAALYPFKEPLTPSEVARRLRVPANVMHYRVKRLHDVGLLEVDDDGSRSRTYKTVAERFSLSPELQPVLGEAVPAMLDKMVGKLHHNLLQRLEAEQKYIDSVFEDGPLEFDLEETFTIGSSKPPEYGTWVSISTPTLSAEQFQKIYQAINTITR